MCWICRNACAKTRWSGKTLLSERETRRTLTALLLGLGWVAVAGAKRRRR